MLKMRENCKLWWPYRLRQGFDDSLFHTPGAGIQALLICILVHQKLSDHEASYPWSYSCEEAETRYLEARMGKLGIMLASDIMPCHRMCWNASSTKCTLSIPEPLIKSEVFFHYFLKSDVTWSLCHIWKEATASLQIDRHLCFAHEIGK